MMAIDENGNLWGCGNNSEGQLGDGTKADKRILVSIKDGTKFKEISAGIHTQRRKQDKIRDGTYGKRQNPLPAADDGHCPGRKLQDGLVLG